MIGNDFTITRGPIIIAPDECCAEIEITVDDDVLLEDTVMYIINVMADVADVGINIDQRFTTTIEIVDNDGKLILVWLLICKRKFILTAVVPPSLLSLPPSLPPLPPPSLPPSSLPPSLLPPLPPSLLPPSLPPSSWCTGVSNNLRRDRPH